MNYQKSNSKKSTNTHLVYLLASCILLVSILIFLIPRKGFQPNAWNDSRLVYVDDTGKQVYGEVKINGNLYYFDPNTGIMQTGFVKIDGVTKYYDQNGKGATGLTKINGDWYYFSKNGTMVQNAFHKIKVKNKTYRAFFLNDGKMATGQVEIKGVQYQFSKSGQIQICTEELERRFQEVFSTYGGLHEIYFKDLSSGTTLSINDQAMYPCSIIKSLVMATVYDQVEQGILDMKSCQDYLEGMMIYSDNTSYNMLVTALGNGDPLLGTNLVNQYCESIDLHNTRIYHGLLPGEGYFYGGGTNTTTPSDIGSFLEQLYKKKIVSSKASDKMLDLMKQCADETGLVATLPENVECAHKSGWAEDEYLDGGIVYSPFGDYILVVFSDSGYQQICQEISQITYEYLEEIAALA